MSRVSFGCKVYNRSSHFAILRETKLRVKQTLQDGGVKEIANLELQDGRVKEIAKNSRKSWSHASCPQDIQLSEPIDLYCFS